MKITITNKVVCVCVSQVILKMAPKNRSRHVPRSRGPKPFRYIFSFPQTSGLVNQWVQHLPCYSYGEKLFLNSRKLLIKSAPGLYHLLRGLKVFG